ncbi:hypothetical protein PHAVU_008G026150 [Phaseolus vulgaris]|uniref:F-box/kelch-repeat protein At3g23880-like isoform X2 n=1 Tax=Phaseolus vulgaris TaxID=3885 RepID=UPI0035CB1DCA
MNNQTLPLLPLEVIREILLRLPVKSLLRFKCVSKSWLSLISDPQFGISHYDLAATPTHRILMRSNDFYAQSIDANEPFIDREEGTLCLLRAVHLLLPPPSPPRIPDFFHFDDFRNQPQILGSCRGFILLYYERGDDLILWNPSIGVHKQLPHFQYDNITREFLYGFGYDPSKDDYLITIIPFSAENEAHVFSFKTASWNSLLVNVPYSDPGNCLAVRAGSLFNETLHWLVFSKEKNVAVILAFDLVQRSFSEISLLDHLTTEKCGVCGLRVVGGCLGVCYSVEGSATTEIWVMKEYKVHSSWAKFIVVPTCDFSPICITKDGGIFGSDMRSLEKYDDKGQLLEHRAYGVQEELFYCLNLQCAIYRESLLSLPTVIRNTSEEEHQQLIRKIRAAKLTRIYS